MVKCISYDIFNHIYSPCISNCSSNLSILCHIMSHQYVYKSHYGPNFEDSSADIPLHCLGSKIAVQVLCNINIYIINVATPSYNMHDRSLSSVELASDLAGV